MNRRILALLLAITLLISITGCGAEENPPTTTVPATNATEPPVTEAPALHAYADARTLLENASQLRMKITTTKTTVVGGEEFTEKNMQTLLCAGLDTDSPTYSSHEDISYGSAYYVVLDEICAGGNLYVTVDDTYLFSGTISPEDTARRYVPAVMLDETLYEDITAEDSLITFRSPTAAEEWAMPEGAELVDASGSALLGSAGNLQKYTYTLSYRYGAAEITLEAEAYITEEPVTVPIPEDASAYTQLEYVDAARLSEMALGYLYQSKNATLSCMESIMCQAAGVIRNQSTTVNTYSTGKNLHAKVETNVYFMDYSTGESQEYKQEELFRDGAYTLSVDGGEPEKMGVTADMMEEYCLGSRGAYMVAFDFWHNATATDLGSLYLLELTLTDQFGDVVQESICETLFSDGQFLNDYASDYATNETTGYIAIDKYTGLPTAAGYYYEGTHTIEGQGYVLSMQTDQSIEAPDLGAYYAITEEMLPEEEPEEKPTPLLYHVTGEDGQEMWLFGTIHVGDSRTAYLPQEIYSALASSDALALEYDSEAFDELAENDEALQDAISDAYYYSDGTTTADHISEDLYETAISYLKATGSYNMNSEYMKAYLWSNLVDNFYLRQGYGLTSHQGLETRLQTFAEAQGIEIRDVESGLFQIQMLTGFSDELQELLLEEALETDAQESWTDTMELYESWCAGDEETLREILSDEVDTSELTEEELAEYEEYKHLLEEYNQAMSYDRNDNMLNVAIEYLESGDVVFYAVGLAHLLNNVNGLVDTLRDAGYTVELVTYDPLIEPMPAE